MIQKKQCESCCEETDIRDFYSKGSYKGKVYLSRICKSCDDIRRRIYWQKNAIEKRPWSYFDCPECPNSWPKRFGEYCARCGNKGVRA